jgi:Bacterial Ig domain
MRKLTSGRLALLALLAFGVLAVACSNGSSAAAGGGPTLSIASPADGAKVSEPFTVRLNASVPLGDPSTGNDHVHLCFDGASCDQTGSYQLVYGDSTQVKGLSPGQHTIEASLRNADHSAVGPTTRITVTVTGGASGGSPSSSGGYGGGYGSPSASSTRGY